MSRSLENWIDAFSVYSEVTGSPARLRRWAGIACVAGALERKVWVHTKGSNLYPNIYMFLVSPPGQGKSMLLNSVRDFWAGLKEHKLAASSVSKASLIDDLHDAHRAIVRAGCIPSTVEFHSLKVLVSELGVFLPEFANDFMNTLTDLYDGYPYVERKRTKNLQIHIDKPQLNLLAGTTPSYLANLLPDGAWDQGFLSRTILIYDAERILTSMFAVTKEDAVLKKHLQNDLAHIGRIYGEMTFTQEAAEFIDAWYLGGQAPAPTHPKLQHYLTRRPAHILKLSQVACIARTDTLVVELQDVQLAMNWLFEAESVIPDIFKSMASGGDGKIMEECWHFLFQWKAKFQKGTPKSVVLRFLSQKVPSHNVERVLKLMEDTGMVRCAAVKGEGELYEPKERNPFG